MSKEIVCAIASEVGIKIGTDIKVYDERFYDRVLRQGSLALGETFMLGWWNVGDPMTLDNLFYLIGKQNLREKFIRLSLYYKCYLFWHRIKNFLFPPASTIESSLQVAQEHYNLNNHFFSGLRSFYGLLLCLFSWGH